MLRAVINEREICELLRIPTSRIKENVLKNGLIAINIFFSKGKLRRPSTVSQQHSFSFQEAPAAAGRKLLERKKESVDR